MKFDRLEILIAVIPKRMTLVLSFVLLFAGEGTNSPRTRGRKTAVGVRDATSGCAGGRTQTEGAGERNGNDKDQGRSREKMESRTKTSER